MHSSLNSQRINLKSKPKVLSILKISSSHAKNICKQSVVKYFLCQYCFNIIFKHTFTEPVHYCCCVCFANPESGLCATFRNKIASVLDRICVSPIVFGVKDISRPDCPWCGVNLCMFLCDTKPLRGSKQTKKCGQPNTHTHTHSYIRVGRNYRQLNRFGRDKMVLFIGQARRLHYQNVKHKNNTHTEAHGQTSS